MSRHVDRRRFLGTLAGSAVAGASLRPPSGAHVERPTRILRVAVLSEPGFPAADVQPVPPAAIGAALEGLSIEYLAAADLDSRLTADRFDVYVNPYGSAIPKDGWPALLRYLLAGGGWVNLGGAPCAVPVAGSAGAWQAQARSGDYLHRLGAVLEQAVSTAAVTEWRAAPRKAWAAPLAPVAGAATVWELYYRLSSAPEVSDESGSSGAREAVVTPLVHGLGADGRALVAPYVRVDRLEGDFAGGRWMFAAHDGAVAPEALRAMVEAAGQGAELFEARTGWACYREGEAPSVTASYRGRLAAAPFAAACALEVFDARGRSLARATATLTGAGQGTASATADLAAALPARLAPGLYRLEATLTVEAGDAPRDLTYTSGFWVRDEALLGRGEPLVAGDATFRFAGEPYPVTGTTYMASDVHRKYLQLPNPWLWDRDFAAMKAAGVNLVRTGLWTGWRTIMREPGTLDEAVLRALDAFLLTARRHDVPVIFTLFAFLPESWGGENPYLDPKALAAQRAFVTAIARRYAGMRDLIWDLINEPSFCNKDHLWSCRPNYDGFERAAWAAWVRERKVAGPDGVPPPLPSLDDFREGAGAPPADPARDLRVREYRLFAQVQFARWVRFMTAALRAVAPRQLITVGQDEAGTRDSPNNLFLAPDLDFTCIHTWWLNDALAWDEVITRASGKLNLVEETGVMFAARPAGVDPRWEAYARDLLERKMALALGLAGGAGFIEWVWNSNCYMPSDNEAAIGFLRADGTAKPELAPFLGLAAFAAAARAHLVGRRPEPVLLVVPHANMFSPRNTATDATKQAVRALLYGCRVGVQAISEYALGPRVARPKAAVVPDGLQRPEAKAALAAWARAGTVLLEGAPDVEAYRRLLERAGVRPGFNVTGAEPTTLVHAVDYQNAVLFTLVSESSAVSNLRVVRQGSGRSYDVSLPAGRAALLLVGRKSGEVLAKYNL